MVGAAALFFLMKAEADYKILFFSFLYFLFFIFSILIAMMNEAVFKDTSGFYFLDEIIRPSGIFLIFIFWVSFFAIIEGGICYFRKCTCFFLLSLQVTVYSRFMGGI
ncbi:hypothetical protein P40_08140 [Alloalcanivorax xenomutans]|nr:hypothetical protein P40_08140 [Alloalcanivorax xenomutans]